MAVKKGDGQTSRAKAQPKPVPVQSATGKYNAVELAKAARTRFGVSPELVSVALQQAGKSSVTVDEAKIIIDKFKERKVQ